MIGILVPLAASGIRRLSSATPSSQYVPLGAVATGLIVLATTRLTGANQFVAAFSAGSTIATVAPRLHEEFEEFGDLLAELAKLAALLLFGALLTPALFGRVGISGWIFVILGLTAVRPASVVLALLGRRLPAMELATIGWFGPKGFASAIYAILVLRAGVTGANRLFDLAATAVAASILVHSSTDVPIARRFARMERQRQSHEDGRRVAPITDPPALRGRHRHTRSDGGSPGPACWLRPRACPEGAQPCPRMLPASWPRRCR